MVVWFVRAKAHQIEVFWKPGWIYSVYDSLRSLYIWLITLVLMLGFLPFISLARLLERDPLHPVTSRWVRTLSRLTTRINPSLDLHLEGFECIVENQAYVVVANHQSFTDIPLISHLPLPMKWVAKASLFGVPVLGWLMKLEGDIPVRSRSSYKKNSVLTHAQGVLESGVSVLFFPEGRRAIDGLVNRFSSGAFELAIRSGKPILPVVIDGLWDLLPMHSWKFKRGDRDIRLQVLEPIETAGLTVDADLETLRKQVRHRMLRQLAAWRDVHPAELDRIVQSGTAGEFDSEEETPIFVDSAH